MRPRSGFWVVLLLPLLACNGGGGFAERVRPIDSPAGPGSLGSDLSVGDDGTLYLSWIEPAGEEHALRFAAWQGDAWSAPRTIATGGDWFVNWADFPSLSATSDGTLAAHWLVRSGEIKYAYDVRLAVSRDGGQSWTEPFAPHDDGTATEHGFVSVVPRPDGEFDIVWLDGRETAVDERDEPLGTGVMTLRSARILADGSVTDGRLIDERVCDCCSTDLVRSGDGALVAAYRDRSTGEIRDIMTSRLGPDGWTPGNLVHEDAWKISACPVNGPALAVANERVACAWFTAPGQYPAVNVAFSTDGGRTFADPIRIDSGDPVGRVDTVLLDDGTAVISWIEQGAIRLRWADASGPSAEPLAAVTVDDSRATGFPRLALVGDQLFLAWTEPGEPSRVRTASIPAR